MILMMINGKNKAPTSPPPALTTDMICECLFCCKYDDIQKHDVKEIAVYTRANPPRKHDVKERTVYTRKPAALHDSLAGTGCATASPSLASPQHPGVAVQVELL